MRALDRSIAWHSACVNYFIFHQIHWHYLSQLSSGFLNFMVPNWVCLRRLHSPFSLESPACLELFIILHLKNTTFYYNFKSKLNRIRYCEIGTLIFPMKPSAKFIIFIGRIQYKLNQVLLLFGIPAQTSSNNFFELTDSKKRTIQFSYLGRLCTPRKSQVLIMMSKEFCAIVIIHNH